MKLLFLDLDGTLLNCTKEVPEENRKALEEARAQGHKVILCSGRPLSAMQDLISDLDLNGPGCYVVSYNGGQIYDTYEQKTLYINPLEKEEVVLLFEEAARDGIHVQTYSSDYLLVKEIDRETEFYTKTTGIRCKPDSGLPYSLEELPVKVLLSDLDGRQRLEKFRQRMAPQLEGKIDMFYSSDQFLECVRTGVNKGSAVQWLAGYLGVPMENTYAAGDSENDLPMIQAAAHGCAMANAEMCVKDAASYITENDCDHAGVAEIIRRFILD